MKIFFSYLFIALFISFNAIGQIKISEANVQFVLPDVFSKTLPKKDLGNGRLCYSYKRNPIVNQDGVKIIPNLAVITEPVPKNTDLVDYSAQRRIDVPFKVIDVFSNDAKNSNLTCENSIGYKGSYESHSRNHIVYIIHLIHNNCGVQIIMDATEDVIGECESEFIEVMKSLKSY